MSELYSVDGVKPSGKYSVVNGGVTLRSVSVAEAGVRLEFDVKVTRLVGVVLDQTVYIQTVSSGEGSSSVVLPLQSLESVWDDSCASFQLRAEIDDGRSFPVLVPNAKHKASWKRHHVLRGHGALQDACVCVTPDGHVEIGLASVKERGHLENFFRFEHEISSVKLKSSGLEVSFALKTLEEGEFVVKAVTLVPRDTGSGTARSVSARVSLKSLGESTTVSAFFGVAVISTLAAFRYQLFAVLEESGSDENVVIRIDRLARTQYVKLYQRLLAPRTNLSNERVLVLSTNAHTSLISFMIRDKSVREMRPGLELVRIAAAKFAGLAARSSKRPRRPTALIFEKQAATAQDNGFAVFRHLVDMERAGLPIPFDYRFVMDLKSRQATRVLGMPHVIDKFSLRVWALLAVPGTFTVSSDTRFHLAEQFAQPDQLNKYLYNRPNYFLQHGVLAFKKVGLFNGGHAMRPDRVLASTSWEREAIESSGIRTRNIDVIGLPRWDMLCPSPASNGSPRGTQRLLFMPTWRPWLEGLEAPELLQSQYVARLREFLSSPGLQAVLQTHEAELALVLHPLLHRTLLSELGVSGRVRTLSPDSVEFSRLVRESDFLLTDYSSLVWDFARMGKVSLLYQFDRSRWEREVGFYPTAGATAARELFWASDKPTRVIAEIDRLLADGRQSGEALLSLLLPPHDQKNSAKVVAAIERSLPQLTSTRPLPSYDLADKEYHRRQRRVREAVAKNLTTEE